MIGATKFCDGTGARAPGFRHGRRDSIRGRRPGQIAKAHSFPFASGIP
jgi:hypothetical protein